MQYQYPQNQTDQAQSASSKHVQQSILFTGSMEEIVANIVNLFWDFRVLKIHYLVGYDVSNYLVVCQNNQDGKQIKLVVKIYRNCSEESIKIVEAENWVLNKLNKVNEKCVYPSPLGFEERKNENKAKREQKQIQTDKLIMYNIETDKVYIPDQNSNVKNQSSEQHIKQQQKHSNVQKIKGSNVNEEYKLTSLKSMKGISYHNIQVQSHKTLQTSESQLYHQNFGKVVNIQVEGAQLERVYVRVLVYIEGTMLGDIIAKQNQQQSIQYQHTIINDIPKQIATSITIALQQISQDCRQHTDENKQCMVCRYKKRQLQWHIKSFLKKPQYFAFRYNLIKSNPNRNHFQLISYFVNLYQQVLATIDFKNVRVGLIHNDLNQWNILRLSQQDRGYTAIDYGDMAYSYIVQDIAIYTTYIIYNNPTHQSIKQKLPQIIGSFSEVVPLSMDQLKILYISIPIRMCISLCNSQYSASKNPNNDYLTMSQKQGWKLLIILKQLYAHNGSEQNINLFQSQLWHSVAKYVNFKQEGISQLQSETLNSLKKNEKNKVEDFDGEHWTSEDEFWEEEDQHADKQEQCSYVYQLMQLYYPHILEQSKSRPQIKRMPGYITKNYRIRLPIENAHQSQNKKNKGSVEYVMKVYRNIKRLKKYSEVISSLNSYIAEYQSQSPSACPTVYIPTPVAPAEQSAKANGYCIVRDDKYWRCQIMMRLLTFVEGQSYSHTINQIFAEVGNKKQLDAVSTKSQSVVESEKRLVQFIGSLGTTLGRLDQIMSTAPNHLLTLGYEANQLAKLLKRKNYEWNFTHTSSWLVHLSSVADQNVQLLILYMQSLFCQNCELDKLRQSLVHMDPTEDNCLVSPYNEPGKVDSIIDFDQIQIQYTIVDLVCVLAHCFHRFQKVDQTGHLGQHRIGKLYGLCIGELVSKFRQQHELTQQEISCIYYFLSMRISMCIVLESRDKQSDPTNTHIDFDLHLLIQYLKDLSKICPKQFEGCLLRQKYQANNISIHGNNPISQLHKLLIRIKKQNRHENWILAQEQLWSYDWIRIKLHSDQKVNQLIPKQSRPQHKVRQLRDLLHQIGINDENKNIQVNQLLERVRCAYQEFQF